MVGKNQHVVPHNNDWAVKGEGNIKATAVVKTQNELHQKSWTLLQPNQVQFLCPNTAKSSN
jgi:hypothetical protein